VALIYPGTNVPSEIPTEWKRIPFASGSLPPLGLFYLKASLDQDNHTTYVMDHSINEYPLPIVMRWIKKIDPEIVGLSVLAFSFKTAIKIAQEIKNKFNPNVKIIFGNYHATSCAEKIIQNYGEVVDFCIRGEAEFRLPQLLDAIENHKSYENIRGLTYRHNGKIINTPDPPLIENLDTLPFPDRNCIKAPYKLKFFGIDIITKKMTAFVASRGCTFHCTYCASSEMNKHKLRKRSISNIIDELLLLYNQGYRHIVFNDAYFNINRKYLFELISAIKKENLDMSFSCQCRVDQHYSTYRALAEGNFISILFGIESGNDQILQYYQKRSTTEQNRTAVKLARKAGIDTIVCSYVLGGPVETMDQVKDTIRFALSLDSTFINLNILEAIPGTQLWNTLVQKGQLDESKYWQTGVPVVDLGILRYSKADLIREIVRGYMSYYNLFTRPIFIKEVTRYLTNREKLQYLGRLISKIWYLPLLFRQISTSFHPELE
jgi:anaerobic magnesium-protoporphyrin IX monomethyl ester cyclase